MMYVCKKRKDSIKPSFNQKKIRVLFYWFVLILFLKPAVIDQFDMVDFVFNMGRFAFSMVFVFLAITKRKLDKSNIYYFIIFITVLLSTVLFGGMIPKVLARYFPAIGCLAFIAIYRRRIQELIPTLIDIYILFLIVNLLTMIIAPNGLVFTTFYRRIWFLGNKQNFGAYIFPALFYGAVVKDDNKFKWKILIALSIANAIRSLSLGLILALIVFMILYFGDGFLRNIKPTAFFWIIFVGIVLVVVFSFSYERYNLLQEFLRTIQTPGTSKDITVGARAEMWAAAVLLFLRYPIMGVGSIDAETWHSMTTSSVYYEAIDNVYLDVLMTGGIIGILLYLTLIYKNYKYYKKLWLYKSARIGCYCLFALCILGYEVCIYAPIATSVMVYSYCISSDFLKADDLNRLNKKRQE